MNRFSKVIALALAATMVFGSSLTAFADAPTSGGSDGTGSSEGHVEKKATNVVLPTIAENTTPFAYIMDPEGLVVETAGAKYPDAVFPAKAGDTRVYFNNGTNDQSKTVYANSSKALTVENKSSFDIDLTVTAAVANAQTTDIPLVAQSALDGASAASLYLGLVVGTGEAQTKTAITSASAATKTVTIAGSPDNFKIAVNAAGTDYEYRALTLDEYKALDGNSAATAIPWESDTFSLEGEVTQDLDITSTTTAPKISVTWSWADPSAAPTTYTVTYNANYVAEGADAAATATETVNVGSNPNAEGEDVVALQTREGYTFKFWGTGASATEEADLSEITSATTLYAIWEEDVVIEEKTGYALWSSKDSVFYVGTSNSAGFSLGDDEVTSVKVNDKAVDFDTVTASSGDWVSVTPAAIQAVGEDNGWAHGTELEFEVAFGNYLYTATYTQP